MSRVTLTGKFTRIDGTPATGTVRVTPSRSPIMDSAGRVVISGPQSFPVQSGGLLEVEIPASNDPDLGPAFTYRIEVILDHASWKISKVWIPHGSTTVDLSQVSDFEPVPGVATRVITIPADGADGQVLVWDGVGFSWMDAPAGPPGPPGEVTTSALTTALEGTVSGTGMTVRVDTTVGTRVLLDHPGGSVMLHGDTGRRDIYTLTTTGTWDTPTGINQLILSRIGNIVYLEGRLVRTTATAGRPTTAETLFTAPEGFKPHRYSIRGIANVGTNIGIVSTISAAARIDIAYIPGQWAVGDVIAVSASWRTIDPWPTTLPGLPA